jgi:hypothetical protein
MYLDTALKRGSDKSGSVAFEYHTTSPSNCDDLTEQESVQPGSFGNYVWAVGAGGPNSGKVAVDLDSGSVGEGYNAIGIYMVKKDYPDVKRIGKGPNVAGGPTHLRANVISDLARAKVPDLRYSVDLSPVVNIYYGKDFSIEMLLMLMHPNGSKVWIKQRVYECACLSDNNMKNTPLI